MKEQVVPKLSLQHINKQSEATDTHPKRGYNHRFAIMIKNGFSLVEIIIVIAIMAILIGVIALAIIPSIVKSRESKDLTTINNVLSAANLAVANARIETTSKVAIKLSPDVYNCPADGTANGGPDGFKASYDEAMSGSVSLGSTPCVGKDIYIVITGKHIEVIVGSNDKSHAAHCEYTDSDKGSGKQLFYVTN